MKKFLQTFSILLSCVFLLGNSSCSRQEDLTDTVRLSLNEPISADPHMCQTVETRRFAAELFEGLLSFNEKGETVPGVAERWDVSPDKKTYTFYLRPTARWSNNDPVTAHDFVFSFQRAVDPKIATPQSYCLFGIVNAQDIVNGKKAPSSIGVRAIDDLTLEINLVDSDLSFLELLKLPITMPVHKQNLDAHGKEWLKPGKLVSNGPYVLKEWLPHESLTLEKNPFYWDHQNVALSKVIIVFWDNIQLGVKRFVANEVDVMFGLPLSLREWVRKKAPETIQRANYWGIYYYGINMEHPLFNRSPKLRRAIMLAIDREALCEKLFHGSNQPAVSFVPPFSKICTPYIDPELELPYAERLRLAQKLLAESGYTKEIMPSLEITYNTQEDHKKIAIAVSSMLKKGLGISVKLRNEEWKVFLDSLTNDPSIQLFRGSWIGEFEGAGAFLDQFQSDSSVNRPRFKDLEFDRLLTKGRKALTIEQQQIHFQAAEKRLLDSGAVIPLYYYISTNLVSPRLIGFVPNLHDIHPCKYLKWGPKQ